MDGKASKLQQLQTGTHHEFTTPKKCINEGPDVTFFLSSKAYADIMTWLLQLNGSVFPRQGQSNAETWSIGAVDLSPQVSRIIDLLHSLDRIIDETPPDTSPRRFGNIAFRKWHSKVEQRLDGFFDIAFPDVFRAFPSPEARSELSAYFLGSLGSAERLDYGSGHELSFLAFLGALWKLGAFNPPSEDGSTERGIVLGAANRYLDLIRKLIKTYTLEPAGSHGVWGLDDHSFAPYIFGSAQYAPAISDVSQIPPEGSLPSAPDPGDVAKINRVTAERDTNMYFGAIGFIYDVKKGPFWEHSPMLFDISGVRGGWAKINKGMIKMYNAEVLSKFPVVQHFPFGSLYSWERDPTAKPIVTSAHIANQPTSTQASSTSAATAANASTAPSERIPASLNPPVTGFVGTAAPWATKTSALSPAPTSTNASANPAPPAGGAITTAPWASRPAQPGAGKGSQPSSEFTRAPWAGQRR